MFFGKTCFFKKKKKETTPLFKPTMGLTNIHGTQSADLEKYTQNKLL